MSIEFNSNMNKVLEESARNRANRLAVSSGVINNESVSKSGAPAISSEFSIEDIANAIRYKENKQNVDNDFVVNYSTKVRPNKKSKVEAVIETTQNKINDIAVNTEVNLERASVISDSLSYVRANPFTSPNK